MTDDTTTKPVEPKIKRFPSTPTNPEILLHQFVEMIPELEGVAVVAHWKSGDVTSHWSQMSVSSLCMMSHLLHYSATKKLLGE